jgi:hypothetical protein
MSVLRGCRIHTRSDAERIRRERRERFNRARSAGTIPTAGTRANAAGLESRESMQGIRPITRICSASILLALAACGSSSSGDDPTTLKPGDPFKPHESGNVSAIGDTDPDSEPATNSGDPTPESPVLVGAPAGDVMERGDIGEICVGDGLCEVPDVDASGFCEREGGPVDLIYVDGVVVETICYPPADDPDRPTENIATTTPGDVEVVQNANKTTVTFDPATDGMPIEGNISVDGNNVAIYGNGPDNTVLDGDVALDGNNARLRGLTITGDLIIRKNNVAVVLCRVLGNVRLETSSTNGSVFAQNEIWGDFTSDSNGNILVANSVLGAWEHTGNGNTCDGNHVFADADGDESIDDDERGELLICD